MQAMPQIDELTPDLNIAEWVQGESSNIKVLFAVSGDFRSLLLLRPKLEKHPY